jgi:hypothetical protein
VTRSRDYYAPQKSCGHSAQDDCECPIQDEPLEFPYQERIRRSIAKILARPKFAVGVDISRNQTTIIVSGTPDDPMKPTWLQKDDLKKVRGQSPSQVIFDEIQDYRRWRE